MIIGTNKKRKDQKRLSVLLRAAEMKLFNGPSTPIKRILLENGRLVVVLDERIRSLNYEEAVLFRRYVEAWMIKVYDTKSIFSQWRPCPSS